MISNILFENSSITTFKRQSIPKHGVYPANIFQKISDYMIYPESVINLENNQIPTRFSRKKLESDKISYFDDDESSMDVTVPLQVQKSFKVKAKVIKRSKMRPKPFLDY